MIEARLWRPRKQLHARFVLHDSTEENTRYEWRR